MTKNERATVNLALKLLLDGYIKSLTLSEFHTPLIVAMFELKSLLTEDEFSSILASVRKVDSTKVLGGGHA